MIWNFNWYFADVADFTLSKVSEICARLASCRLVLAEQDRAGIKQRISLNVNPDDLHYALKTAGQIWCFIVTLLGSSNLILLKVFLTWKLILCKKKNVSYGDKWNCVLLKILPNATLSSKLMLACNLLWSLNTYFFHYVWSILFFQACQPQILT